MTINFYQYSLKDSSTYSNPSYMAYGYADAEKLGSVSGQTKLSIDYSIPCNGASDTCACSDDDATEYSASQVVPVKRGVKLCSDNTTLSSKTEKRENDDCDQGAAYWSSDLFGFYTTPTNVTVEMTGYFLPPKTGTYTFGFATVDDSAILSVGGNVAFECCKQEQPPITSTDFTINGIKPWNADAPTDIKGSTYMYAGYYYPIKIVYSNAVSWGTLPVSVVLPDGTEVNDDFEGYVFSFDDNATQAHCSVPNPAEHARTCVSSATSSWSSSEVCTECTETESTSYVTPYVTSSSWSSSEVCTECTETESTSYVTPYVSSSTAAANYTSSFSSSSEVCTECTETESTSTSTPYATSSTGTATSFTASTSNTMTSLVQTDTTVSFSLSSTVSEHTNAPTSSVESNASTFISSNKGSVKSYVTSSIHSITPMYPSNQTVTSSSVVSTPITSESSESSASVTILPSTITSEFKPSTMKTKVVSISSSPTNLITSYDTTSKDSTVGSSTSSVSLISSISLPSSYSASSEQIFHSSIVSSNGQAFTSFSSTKVSSSESSESHRTSPTTSSESGIKSSGVEIESTSTSSFSFHETSTASTSVQISSQFVTPSSPISTVAPRSTGLNSQTESTNSSKETMSSENSASVMPSSSATSPKTGKVTSDETSSGFSRDRTTVYRMTSETPSTNEQTTLITVSSCESNSCSNTVSSAVVSTATTTINGITTEYTTWCPLSATELTTVSKLESEEKTTLITVTSCESGVCSETASPAIVSTATATVNDVVTVYSTWSPQATNKLAVSSDIENSASKASFVSEAAETKSISRNNNFVPTSGTTSIETHTTTTSNASENSDNVSASEAVSSKSVTNPVLISVSQQPRGTPASSMIGSSTASLEMSSYLGIANHLLTNSGISIFIASLLLAIV
ncbi:AEH_G0034660.mRNA.1.CDS.1 [Saccharomyces cerevisiae]|nr:Flo10p [Saccharomyces cerevisiae PE-2]CAI4628505.1 AEH_G0034660.mRNA.1.CDS.1 [Saccharomyces cerevisiae]CAI6623199.1 CNT_HP1_G0033100.mRNA.1.CDS.1 [Saccharomyces cerevisiae]CAI6786854.1 AEH_G0034660.mRNA.1.CDS.1 [Saccharomyces cerevisiae]